MGQLGRGQQYKYETIWCRKKKWCPSTEKALSPACGPNQKATFFDGKLIFNCSVPAFIQVAKFPHLISLSLFLSPSLSLSGTCLELPAIVSSNFLNKSNSFSIRQRGQMERRKEGGMRATLETDENKSCSIIVSNAFLLQSFGMRSRANSHSGGFPFTFMLCLLSYQEATQACAG